MEELLVAALGDSITAGSPGWDPNPAVRERIGPALDERSQFELWAERADPRLRFRNCGVYGERTDEIARRLDASAAGADALLVQGGINDVAQGRPVDAAAQNLRAMVRRGLELGLRMFLADVLPWNAGFPRTEREIRTRTGSSPASQPRKAWSCCPSTRRSRIPSGRAGFARSGSRTATTRRSR